MQLMQLLYLSQHTMQLMHQSWDIMQFMQWLSLLSMQCTTLMQRWLQARTLLLPSHWPLQWLVTTQCCTRHTPPPCCRRWSPPTPPPARTTSPSTALVARTSSQLSCSQLSCWQPQLSPS